MVNDVAPSADDVRASLASSSFGDSISVET